MVYNNIPTFSALTLWITSRHTRPHPLIPQIGDFLYISLHWFCFACYTGQHFHFCPLPAGSAVLLQKKCIYIYYIILPQKYWRCNHTRARSGQTEKTRFRGLFTCNILSVRVSLERWEQLSWRIAEFCRFDSGADPNTGSAVLLWWTCQDKGTSRCWDVRVCATEAEQHNKGVVTAREEFPRDRRM